MEGHTIVKQRLHSSLGELDVLTRLELEESLSKNSDKAVRDLYRGVDYVEWNGNGGGATTFTIPETPDSGYTWSLRLISVTLLAVGNVAVYLGDNITSSSCIGGGPTGIKNVDNVFIFYASTNQIVYKDGRSLTIGATQGIDRIKILAKQVPSEMVGKL
jgi:hypothetical protein